MTADTDEGAHLRWPDVTEPLHQPRRRLIAVVELWAAVVLAALAGWLWSVAVQRSHPLTEHPTVEFTEYSGPLVALCVFAGAGAVLALVDAIRHLVLSRPSRVTPRSAGPATE